MVDISNWLETIKKAVYGKDMRSSIYNCIKALNEQQTTKQNEDDVKRIASKCIQYAISGLFPEYTMVRITETVEANSTFYPSGGVPYYRFDKDIFDCEIDGLLIWIDSTTLLPPALYSLSKNTDTKVSSIEFHTSFKIGQTVDLHIYKKPIAATGTAFGEAIGIADGYSTTAVSGIAEEEEEEES